MSHAIHRDDWMDSSMRARLGGGLARRSHGEQARRLNNFEVHTSGLAQRRGF
jgi:hypothetical protein